MSSRYTSTRGTFDSPASWRYSSSSSSSTSSSRPSSFDYSSPYSSSRTAGGGYGRSSRLADVGSVGKGYSTSASAVASPRSYDTGVSSYSSSTRSYDAGVSSVSSPRSYDYGLRGSSSTELGTRYVSRSSSLKGEDSSDSGQRLTRGSYARSSIPTRSADSPRGSRSSLSSEPSLERREEGSGGQGVTTTDHSARRERLRATGLASSSGDSYRSFSSSRDDDATSASSALRRSQRAQNGSAQETGGEDAASGRPGAREYASWRQRRGLAADNGSSVERSSEADSSKESATRTRRTPASTEELLSRASALRRSRRQMEQEEREREEREKEEKERKEREKEEKERKEREREEREKEREKEEREKEKEERERKERERGRGRETTYDKAEGQKFTMDFVRHPVVTATIFTTPRSADRLRASKEDSKKGEAPPAEAETERTSTRSSLRRFRGDKDKDSAAEETTSAAKPEESSSEPRTFRRYGQRSARTEGQGQPKVEVSKVTGEPRVELQKTASSITISERLSPTELARDEARTPTAQEVKTSSSSSSTFTSHRTVPPSSHAADARTDWKDSALSSRDGARSGRGDFVFSTGSGKQELDSTATVTVKKSWREEADKARALATKPEDSKTPAKTEVGSGEGPVDALDARAQRIARYKEERRQQLETMMSSRLKFFSGPGSSDSGSDSKPSLFLSCSSKGDDSDDAAASKGLRRSKSAAEKHSPRPADTYKTDSDSGETSRRKGNLTRTASSHIPRQTTEATVDLGQDPLVLDTSNITVRTRRGRQLPQPKGQDSVDGEASTKSSQTTHAPTESSRSALGRSAGDRYRLGSSESGRAESPSKEVETTAGTRGEGRQVERSPSSRSPRVRRKLPEVQRSASDASSATKVTVPIRETLDTARITYFKTAGSGERSRADAESVSSTPGKARDIPAKTSSKTEVQAAGGVAGEEARAVVTLLSPGPTVLDELLEKNAAFLSDLDSAAAAGAGPRLLSVGENPAGRKSLKRRPGQRSSRTGSSDSDSRVSRPAGATRGSKEDAVIDTPTLAPTEVKVEVKDTPSTTTTVPSAVVRLAQSSSVDPDVTSRTRHRDVTDAAETATTSTTTLSLEADGKGKEREKDGETEHPPKSPSSRRRAALGELASKAAAEKDLPPRSPSSRRREPAVSGGGDKDLPPKSPSARRRARRGDDSLDRDEAATTATTTTSLADRDASNRSPASRRRARHADASPSSSDVTTDRAGRRRFITRPPEPPKDSGSDSVFDTAPSAPSSVDLPRRRQRKDKSGVRKSELNKSEDNEASNQSSASVGTDRSVDKISAAVHMFQEPHADSKKAPSQAEPKIPRRADFSQLVKKFSSSEASASEKSDAEKQLHRRPAIRRQNPVEKGSSSDESNTEYARRTPERTQSLRMQSPSDGTPGQGTAVRRTGSFQSKFMRERFDSGSDQPHPELAAVLSQRKTIVTKQEEEAVPFRPGHEVKVVEREETKAKGATNRISEVIADKELASVLRSRRKETDSKSGLAEEAAGEKKKSVEEKASTRLGKDGGGLVVESQVETEVSVTCSVSLPGDKPASSKSALYAIDSSLAVLAKATEDLDTPQEESVSSSTTAASRVPASRPADSDSDSAFASSDSTAKRGGTLADAVRFIQDVETSISSRVAATSQQSLSRSAASVNSVQATSASVVSTTTTTTSSARVKASPEPEETPSVTLTISLPPAKEDSSSVSSSSHSVSVSSSKKTTTTATTTTTTAAASSLSSSSSSLSTKTTTTTPSSVRSIAADMVSTKSSIQSATAISTPNLSATPEEPSPNKPLSTSSTSVDRISPSREDSSSSSSHTTFTLSLSSAVSSPRLDSSAEASPGSRSGSGLRRAESLKDWGSGEEGRRGVLKRTPSLPKQQARPSPGVFIDPQLANIMKKMREKEGNLDEEEEQEMEGRKRTLSAAEEIELARRELRTSSSSSAAVEGEGEKGAGEEEEDDTPMLSVAERIHRMQTRMEESTSRSRSSGHTTPRSPALSKSGTVTPVWQVSIEGVTETSSTTDDVEVASSENRTQNHRQLLERLSSLATEQADTVSVHERRQRFQRRQRDDWRTRTTPVTQEEVSQADSLESVSAFRALVRRQATINMFDKLKDGEKPGPAVASKKPEFPQHLSPAKRQQPLRARQLRHKTLPITAAELAAIPEGESMASESLRSKVAEMGRLQALADSGIVSGSELESMLEREHQHSDSLRSLTLEMDIAEDDPSRLPVSAKTSIFRSMEEKTKQEKERFRSSASGAKRYIERKKRERSMTQPVTEEEVKDASELAVEQKPKVTIHKPEVVNRPKTPPQEPEEPAVEENDELAKLSLKDKVKLFSEQKTSEEKTLPPTEPPVRRRPRKHASRYSTQPVTVEEVQEAATTVRVTPLMLSLVKPPDPELLGGLPLNAQRDLAMQHAQELMGHTRPPARSGSQPSSRRSSLTDGNGDAKAETRGILKSSDSQGEGRQSPERELHGILKSETASSKEPAEPRSILKRGSVDLKLSDVETKGILKHSDSAGNGVQDSRAAKVRDLGGEPRGILKNSKSLEGENGRGLGQEGEPRGILKQESTDVPVKGILKRESSFDTAAKGEKDKGVLKKADSKEGEDASAPVRGILKRDNSESVDRTSPEADAPGFYLGSDEGGKDGGEGSDQREETSPPREEAETRTKRRFQNRKNQAERERYKTQPVDGTPETPSPRRPKYYEGRHLTQPVTPDEMKQAEASSSPVMKASSSGSIADRVQALKRSGEEEWRKRVTKSPSPELTAAEVRLREKPGLAATRPSSIADRLTALEGSQASWKTRVEEGDASKFTVAGRLSKRGGNVVESPLVARLKNTPRKEAIVSSANSSGENSPATSPTIPAVEFKVALPKKIISDGPLRVDHQNKGREEEAREAVRVEVPTIADEDLDAFFQVKSVEEITDKLDVSIDDFNNLFIEANDMLPTVRRIRPSRKQKAVSRNPLKNISVEVRQEYTEVTLGVADREMKRMKREKVAAQAGLAEAALAGLASQENFSKVELRRTEEASTVVPGNQPRFEPYSDLMLLHFKGRRNLQVRLVEPVAASLNSGDCFVLVTPDKIINWVGDFANVIEKARSADVATYIQQKRDLGCRSGVVLHTVEEAKSHLGAGKQFWAAIGGKGDYMGVGPDEEDELFESAVVKTNAIYRLKGNALLPYEDYWGSLPKFTMLQRDEVLVFDFGSELYVWLGKAVERDRRKLGLKLAQQLWDKDYDYSECAVNPLSTLKEPEQGGMPMTGKRPPWALFGKISQNMETILFREKFADWPDSSRLISVKGMDKAGQGKGEAGLDLKPYDAKLLVRPDTRPVTLVLEGSNVGRGNKWFEDMEGFIREQEIMTLGVSVWHVMEYDHFKLDEASYGQMHEGDTYVVRWQYMISAAGNRSRFSLTGRERCAYFFWQGKQSTINEKGASALMTVELDEERGPQVRVVQGKEPPCFLNLFGGAMMVHAGKREDPSTNTQGDWRLYALRGGPHQNETCLLEIPLAIDHFRSRSALLLLDVTSGKLLVWQGCKADKNTRALALAAAHRIRDHRPKETGLEEGVTVTVTELEEGNESSDFWRGFSSKRRTKYCSLRSVYKTFEYTLRLFLMDSVSGVFEATEVLNPSRDPSAVIPFPFLQSDLYKATQPALLLVDNHHEVYLWQGWWPVGSQDTENVRTGSAHARFNVDRRCAMETTLHYCREKNPSSPPPAYMVYAGAEPLEFTNLFPFWEQDSEVMGLARQEGRVPGETPSVEEILARLTKTRYTLEELQADTLPEGVDPLRIESYLEDKEFQELFEMTKEEYNELQPWRQRQLKQQVGLF